ncbi:MAG TPA: hypothetical protein VGJ55_00775 [Pyrinomonadaceae bacterium]
MKSPYSPLGALRRLLALTLMLWCAGAGCLLVSYAHGAMGEAEVGEKASVLHHSSSTAPHEVSGGPASDFAASVSSMVHSCCKAQRASNQHKAPPTASASTAPVAVTTERKSSQSQKQIPAQQSRFFPPQLGISTREIFATELAGLPPPAGAMNCCPLTSASAAGVTKPANDTLTATLLERTTLLAFLNNTESSALTTPLRLPNRGHTYLRCCVFLI